MSAIAAINTVFKQGDGGNPETFTEVANVVSIGDFSMDQDFVDATPLNPTDRFEQVITTLIRTPPFDVVLNFDPSNANHMDFKDTMIAGTTQNFQIVFPAAANNQTWTFSAFVAGFSSVTMTAETKLEATITIKVDGAPSFS